MASIIQDIYEILNSRVLDCNIKIGPEREVGALDATLPDVFINQFGGKTQYISSSCTLVTQHDVHITVRSRIQHATSPHAGYKQAYEKAKEISELLNSETFEHERKGIVRRLVQEPAYLGMRSDGHHVFVMDSDYTKEVYQLAVFLAPQDDSVGLISDQYMFNIVNGYMYYNPSNPIINHIVAVPLGMTLSGDGLVSNLSHSDGTFDYYNITTTNNIKVE